MCWTDYHLQVKTYRLCLRTIYVRPEANFGLIQINIDSVKLFGEEEAVREMAEKFKRMCHCEWVPIIL